MMYLILGPGGFTSNYGKDSVYFPSIDPWIINADIQARGNLSPYEAKEFAIDAEERFLDIKGVDNLFIDVRSSTRGGGDSVGRGYIIVEDPKELDISGWEVLRLLRESVADVVGYKLNVREVQEGPGQFSSPVEIQPIVKILN